MSASQGPALDAIAFQLAAALDRYEQDVDRMVDTWLDMELYQGVGDQVVQIRMYSAALPFLSVHWVEMLIAHAELLHSLWRLRFQEDEVDRGELMDVRERHSAAVQSLKARCLRTLARGELHTV
jgi:hypothetical protein